MEAALPEGLKPFTTDGPSDGYLRVLIGWRHPEFRKLVEKAAFEHDLAYWVGGTEGERADADEDFRNALNPDEFPVLSSLYHGAVRKFGRAPASWRWGFGWRDLSLHGDQISQSEREELKAQARATYQAER